MESPDRHTLLGIAVLLVAGFISIVFIQSGLDKVFNYKGNLSWLKDQFKATFLRNMIGILLPVIMIGELLAGLFCVFGMVQLFLGEGAKFLAGGFVLSGIVLLMLLFGQRVSKQYEGAASLTGYFLIVLIGIIILCLDSLRGWPF